MCGFGCLLWWVVLGGLLGWLASWLFARRTPAVIEKIVDRPVDRVVEKVVEKIVERPVEKLVDNPALLGRIHALEGEAALIAGLRQTIARLESAPPKIIEKMVDQPVEKIVERIADRPVDRPVDRIVEKYIDRPVEKIVEKIIDRPVDRIVEKMVDNPAHLNRINFLEAEVALIAGLRQTIARLEATPPRVVEKIVDRPVDRIVERIIDRPVEKIVEKIVERPVNRVIDRLVDNPAHLERIKTLEAEVAQMASLRQTVARLEATPAKAVEKLVDNPAHLARIRTLESDVLSRDIELEVFRKRLTPLDKPAAAAAGFTVRGMDDLELIEGIGPKIATLLNEAGIHMFWELAETPVARLQTVLNDAGPHYKLANPGTWARQAELAASNQWTALRKLQDELTAGIKK